MPDHHLSVPDGTDLFGEIDPYQPGFGELYDELPLWSAPFGQMLLERVPLERGARILDVGAGTGFLTVELAQRCGPDSVVTAVDPWTSGLDRLRFKVSCLGLDNVRVIEKPIEESQLDSDSMDLVVSNLCLNNLEEPEKALSECGRVLVRGGQLLMTTNLSGHMQELYDVFRQVLLEGGFEKAIGALEEHRLHRGTVASVSDQLTKAGFGEIEVALDSFSMRFADGTSMLSHFLIRFGFLPAWQALVPDGREAVFDRLRNRLDQRAGEEGALSLTIPMACFTARRS